MSYYAVMGIFMLWLLCRANNLLEQVRYNSLTPAERTTEEKAQIFNMMFVGILIIAVSLIIWTGTLLR
jgi:hypothetical protein